MSAARAPTYDVLHDRVWLDVQPRRGGTRGCVRARGAKLLQVKTLGPSKEDPNYARTRHFYEKMGFLPPPLVETELWGEGTPCLIMVKALA